MLDAYVKILPNLFVATLNMNESEEGCEMVQRLQNRHIAIVEEAMELGLLEDICDIRNAFNEMTKQEKPYGA